MTSLFAKRRRVRLVSTLLVTALVGVPWQATAHASEADEIAGAEQLQSSRTAIVNPMVSADAAGVGVIRASVRRLALAESDRLERSGQAAAAAHAERCTASLPEKLAWLYALVGGSILLAYGPQEKEGGVWTMDGKSETVAGATAIALSFALLHDIRKRGW